MKCRGEIVEAFGFTVMVYKVYEKVLLFESHQGIPTKDMQGNSSIRLLP